MRIKFEKFNAIPRPVEAVQWEGEENVGERLYDELGASRIDYYANTKKLMVFHHLHKIWIEVRLHDWIVVENVLEVEVLPDEVFRARFASADAEPEPKKPAEKKVKTTNPPKSQTKS